MKPHPRIRKTIKWTGAAVTVLLLVVWIGSGWWGLWWWNSGGDCAAVAMGSVVMGTQDYPVPASATGLSIEHSVPKSFRWWFWSSDHNGPTAWQVFIPLWLPLSGMLLATAIAWRLDTLARRRAQLNLCPKCTYDRTGLAPNAKCPECGASAGGPA
jgi:hypothetical protein